MTVMPSNIGLEIPKRLLNWVEIGQIWRQETYPNPLTSSNLNDMILLGMMNRCVVHYNDRSRAWVRVAKRKQFINNKVLKDFPSIAAF
jgi:hypothetical protein